MPTVDRPLVTENLVGGEEGLSDSGISLSKLLPNPILFVEATGEVFRGHSNVFESSSRSELNYVGRLRAYRDITEGSNIDIGTSFATGPTSLASGLIKQLMGKLISRAMDAELTHHLGYERGQEPTETPGNRRNGKSRKTVRTDGGPVEVYVPRDREGTFEPQIVGKHERHFDGFDDKIISMYARGMSVRDIRAHLEEIYGVEVSPDLISRVTDAVVEEMRTWQARPLDPVYLVVYLDALVLKIRIRAVTGVGDLADSGVYRFSSRWREHEWAGTSGRSGFSAGRIAA